jgi:hypothetical protein
MSSHQSPTINSGNDDTRVMSVPGDAEDGDDDDDEAYAADDVMCA